MEALHEPGYRDGQNKLVYDGTNVCCYSWSAADKEWVKIGDVVGSSGDAQAAPGKQLYNGKVQSRREEDLNENDSKPFKAEYLVSAFFMNIVHLHPVAHCYFTFTFLSVFCAAYRCF
jgi:hypothetical protein